jgi:hypothetical protein
MSKSGQIWRKAVYAQANKDFYLGVYYNIYADGTPQQRHYQKEWLIAKKRADWCEAWF